MKNKLKNLRSHLSLFKQSVKTAIYTLLLLSFLNLNVLDKAYGVKDRNSDNEADDEKESDATPPLRPRIPKRVKTRKNTLRPQPQPAIPKTLSDANPDPDDSADEADDEDDTPLSTLPALNPIGLRTLKEKVKIGQHTDPDLNLKLDEEIKRLEERLTIMQNQLILIQKKKKPGSEVLVKRFTELLVQQNTDFEFLAKIENHSAFLATSINSLSRINNEAKEKVGTGDTDYEVNRFIELERDISKAASEI